MKKNEKHVVSIKSFQRASFRTFIIFPDGGLDLDEDGTDHFILDNPEPHNLNYELPQLIIVELVKKWRSYGIWRVVNE